MNKIDLEMELKKHQHDQLETYFSQIRTYFDSLKKNKRQYLESLENKMGNLERETEQHSVIEKNPLFDPLMAMKIREIQHISQTELGRILDEPGAQTFICKYERGDVAPRNPPKGKTPKKYLAWLKEHGYNPYNL